MKQVILMRTDLNMSVGKMVAQAVHSCIAPNAPTVVVKVSSINVLMSLLDKASHLDLSNKYVTDAGLTEVPPGTVTCGCIYGEDEFINKITGQLPLL